MLLWVGEVGRVPVATSMSVSVCIDMQVAISRMVMMVGGPVLCWSGSLSHGYVNRWSGGLRASDWGSVLGVFLGEGLKLFKGDNRRRSWWVLSPSNRDTCLWSRVEQGGLGLLSPILKCLSPLGVGCKCSLG